MHLAHSGFLVLRTPNLPKQIFGGSSKLDETVIVDAILHKKKPAEIPADIAPLIEFFNSALSFASIDLVERINKRALSGEKAASFGRERDQSTLHRYLYRASTRSTPFGLFSSNSLGEIGGDTSLVVMPLAQLKPAIFPNGQTSALIVEKLKRALQNDGDLRVWINPTTYRLGRYLKYYRRRTQRHEDGLTLDTLEISPLLERVLRCAQTPKTISQLCTDATRAIGSSNGGNEQLENAVRRVCQQFLASEVLVSEPLNILSEPNLLPYLIARVRAASLADKTAAIDWLTQIDEAIRAVNEAYKNFPAAVRTIEEQLSDVAASVERPGTEQEEAHQRNASNVYLHADCWRPAIHCNMDNVLIGRVLETSGELIRRTIRHNQRYENFRAAFQERFPSGVAPISVALDPAHGIDLRPQERTRISDYEDRLATFLVDSLACGAEAGIDLAKFREAKQRVVDLCDEVQAGSVRFSLRAGQGTKASRSYEISILGLMLGNGAQFVSRFAKTNPALEHRMRLHIAKYTAKIAPQVPFELLHLDSPRLRDVTLRIPSKKSLALYGVDNAEEEEQLQLEDILLVNRGGRLFLWDARLNVELAPQLTSMHTFNSEKSIPLYRFLPLLQYPVTCGFSWPQQFMSASKLPRVHLNGVWIAPASWLFPDNVKRRIREAQWTHKLKIFLEFARKSKLPRFVLVGGGDRLLPVDLENENTMLAAVGALSIGSSRIMEMFEVPGTEVITDRTWTYNNEIVLPFTNDATDKKTRAQQYDDLPPAEVPHQILVRSPTSNWLYFKVFSSPATLQELIEGTLGAWLQELVKTYGIGTWFFIRYSEQGHHLRLRFRLDESIQRQYLLGGIGAMFDSWMVNGDIRRWEISCYEPEYDRYGGAASLEFVERVFCIDSMFALAALQTLSALGEAGKNEILRLALVLSFDRYISAILPTNSRQAFLERELWYVLRSNGHYKKAFETSFRKHRSTIATVLNGDHSQGKYEIMNGIHQHVTNRTTSILSAITEHGVDAAPLPSDHVLSSVLHMSANRLLPYWSAAREQEAKYLLYRANFDRMHRGRVGGMYSMPVLSEAQA